MQLIIGNRNYSSWSLRAWLYLEESGIRFDTTRLSLFSANWQDQVAEFSAAGRVPVLVDDGITVWDSLAIVEHVRENHGGIDWPGDTVERALARAITSEMHSGFLAIRDELPMNVRASSPVDPATLSDACRQQIQRIGSIWTGCLERSGGEWLMGEFGIADVFYAPVALRFLTYAIDLDGDCRDYMKRIRARPAVNAWCEAAAEEPEQLDFIDQRIPASDTELTLG